MKNLPPDVEDFRNRFIAAFSTGTYSNLIVFYRHSSSKIYGRVRSSLSGERVKTSKEFRPSMVHADYLAKASQILKPIYKEVSPDWRCRDVYHKLMSVAIRSVREDLSMEEVSLAIKETLYAMGYQEPLSTWSFPPNLAQWLEEVKQTNQTKPSGVKIQKGPFRFTERALDCRPGYYAYNVSRMAINFASIVDRSGLSGKSLLRSTSSICCMRTLALASKSSYS